MLRTIAKIISLIVLTLPATSFAQQFGLGQYGLGMTVGVDPPFEEPCTPQPTPTLPIDNLWPTLTTDRLPQSYNLAPASFLPTPYGLLAEDGFITLPKENDPNGILEPNGRLASFLRWEASVGPVSVPQGGVPLPGENLSEPGPLQVSVPGENNIYVPGTLVDAVMIYMGLLGPPARSYPFGYYGAPIAGGRWQSARSNW